MQKPLIVVLLGLPGSGKTTFARQLAERIQGVTLSSDAMRLSIYKTREAAQAARDEDRVLSNQYVFGALNYAARQALRAGHNVIFDAVVSHRSEREEKYEFAREFGAAAILVRIQVPREVSLRRMQERTPTEDQRQFHEEKAIGVFNYFAQELEEPTPDEPVVYIDGEAPFETQYQAFLEEVTQLSQ